MVFVARAAGERRRQRRVRSRTFRLSQNSGEHPADRTRRAFRRPAASDAGGERRRRGERRRLVVERPGRRRPTRRRILRHRYRCRRSRCRLATTARVFARIVDTGRDRAALHPRRSLVARCLRRRRLGAGISARRAPSRVRGLNATRAEARFRLAQSAVISTAFCAFNAA
ncbi:MAG: hypothetical protein E6Q50_13400 [Lysobacter sp.]|nr:MAG: hypothetical protein E6Q50_13400 [Lysobacter sp.]